MLFIYSEQRWYSLVSIPAPKREKGIEELEKCQEVGEYAGSLVGFLLCQFPSANLFDLLMQLRVAHVY